MNNSVLLHIVRFVVLVIAQVFIFSKINFLGFINPHIYILFILLYPVNSNKLVFLITSFLLGLSVDTFSDTGGVHAAACLMIAYLRPAVLKFSFGVSYEYNAIKVSNTPFGSRLTYITILVLIHHIVMFSLEVFNISQILLILRSALFSSIFTILLCMVFMILFSRKAR